MAMSDFRAELDVYRLEQAGRLRHARDHRATKAAAPSDDRRRHQCGMETRQQIIRNEATAWRNSVMWHGARNGVSADETGLIMSIRHALRATAVRDEQAQQAKLTAQAWLLGGLV